MFSCSATPVLIRSGMVLMTLLLCASLYAQSPPTMPCKFASDSGGSTADSGAVISISFIGGQVSFSGSGSVQVQEVGKLFGVRQPDDDLLTRPGQIGTRAMGSATEHLAAAVSGIFRRVWLLVVELSSGGRLQLSKSSSKSSRSSRARIRTRFRAGCSSQRRNEQQSG